VKFALLTALLDHDLGVIWMAGRGRTHCGRVLDRCMAAVVAAEVVADGMSAKCDEG
jgi:hypothetical protein